MCVRMLLKSIFFFFCSFCWLGQKQLVGDVWHSVIALSVSETEICIRSTFHLSQISSYDNLIRLLDCTGFCFVLMWRTCVKLCNRECVCSRKLFRSNVDDCNILHYKQLSQGFWKLDLHLSYFVLCNSF